MRAAAILVTAAAGLGACASGSSHSAEPSHAAMLTLPPATTAPPPTTAAAPRPARPASVDPVAGYHDTTPPPVIHATGTNYVAIVRSLEAYRYWLLGHHPDPALVSEFEQRGTIAFQDDVDTINELRRRRWTEISIGQHVTYTVASVHGSLMTFRVHEVITSDRFFDLHHHVAYTHRYDGDNDFVIVMVLGAGNRWRLADVTQVYLDPTIVL